VPLSDIGLHLRERDVARQIKDFLGFRGWRIVRHNVTKIRDRTGRWTSFGENGMPDLQAIYYLRHGQPGATATLWVETKQATGRLRPQQADWHRDELARGAVVVVARKFEDFEKFYWEVLGWVHGPQHGQGHLFRQQPAG